MNSFDLDTYFSFVESLAVECRRLDVSPQDLIEQRTRALHAPTLNAIRIRESVSDPSDRQKVEGLLLTGWFNGMPESDRVGSLLATLDVSHQIEERDLEIRCAKYRESDKLFQVHPSLLSNARDQELIPRAILTDVMDDGLVQTENGYARLDAMLPSAIVNVLATVYPQAPLFVRLDPQKAWLQPAKQLLMETILVPANPTWWRNLGLYRGAETGAQYVIDPPGSAGDDINAFVEYHVHGLRKLETIAQRKEPQHLTMMLEELEERRDGLLIGRCIHLDTSAPVGTPPSEAKVLHVDLAINVYRGELAAERLSSAMNKAEKVKTPVRTHLLRAEQIPFDVLTLLSFMFFKSHILRRDLFINQFVR